MLTCPFTISDFSIVQISFYYLKSNYTIAMRLALINCNRNCFSIFKKKCIPISTTSYTSLHDFYYQIHAFEQTLQHLELKKMPKKLEDFDKKFRRLYRNSEQKLLNVPMSLTHTYEYYCRKVDEMLFGTEQIQTEVTDDQIIALTRKMIQNDLNIYHQQLIPKISEHLSLADSLTLRFINIEERLSRMLFKDYTGFSQLSSKLSLFEEREYKGDFKFILVNDLTLIEKLTEPLHHAALFNKLRNKLTLAAEQAVALHWQTLSSTALSRLMFCLAMNGKSLKIIQDNFMQISQKLKDKHSFQLLFYMIANGFEQSVWFSEISKTLILQPTNTIEQFISLAIKKLLADRFNSKIEVVEREQFNLGKQKPTGQLFFEQFLERHNYQFSSCQNELFYHKVYKIQEKQFICLDHLLVKQEDFSLNGLGLILRQFLLKKDQTLKHINWPRMLPMEKRIQRDQYIFSKFKGMEKPKKIKVRYYD